MNKLLTLSAVLALTTVTVGQTVATVSPDTVTNVTYVGQYEVAAGVFTAPTAGASLVVYDNTITNGSFFPAGAGLGIMDWGTLSASGHNDITDIQIGYATSEFDPLGSGVVSLV